MTSAPAAGDTARGWGWVAHLRAGGTTPWRAWAGTADPGGPFLPGAQQLELLRRLNAAGPPSPALAARVLAATAPGRGRPDLPLAGAGHSRFGPAPVDPEELPDDELVRVATSLVADDVAAAGLPAAPPPPGSRVARRLPPGLRAGLVGRARRVVGDPWQAAALRAELAARGRVPRGPRSRVVVVGADLPTMLVDVWTTRVVNGGAPPWPTWVRSVVDRARVPHPVDLPAVAASWSEVAGPRRVTVCLDPARLPALVGVRGGLPEVARPPADAAELVRRTAPVLGLLTSPEDRGVLLRHRLLPALLELGPSGPPVRLPAEHLEPVRARAAVMREALLAGGYPVVGDPDTLLPRDRADESTPTVPTGPTGPSADGVLDLAVRLLLATDAREEAR